MANKISDFTAITAPATTDVLPILDVSDTTQAASGSTRKITLANIWKVINSFTSWTTPIETDTLSVYDVTNSAIKSLLLWKIGARESSVTTAQFDKTSNNTLSAITGLSYTVTASGTYYFRAHLMINSTANGGHKAMMSGSATATYIAYHIKAQTGTSAYAYNTRVTDLGTTSAGATAASVGEIVMEGTIVVNAGGTLIPYFAQNAAHSDTSSVLRGSTFHVRRIS